MSNQISFTEKAFAKVNLTLEILGRRRDGYHNLASVMQTVDLFDTIEFSESDEVIVTCDDEEITPEINLASKAASVLKQQAGITNGATMTI
ncbi:MAG: 4-(cytidine 5'-diphospho)-2-C-methyl-D-erythritol kinase, partial [Chloroflexi bacterium]|nr:4-(cytidine 5'-diphospho)-2-C-methyl-D-erythritol kinase [Chloroflexota bacterium]